MRNGDEYFVVDFIDGDENNVFADQWQESNDPNSICNRTHRMGLAFRRYEDAKNMAQWMLELEAPKTITRFRGSLDVIHDHEYDVAKHVLHGVPRQGDLVYITHPNRKLCGWYQKLRVISGDVRYVLMAGEYLGHKLDCKEVDANRTEYRITKKIIDGENVVKFITGGFSDHALVIDLKDPVNREIAKLKARLKELEEKNNA